MKKCVFMVTMFMITALSACSNNGSSASTTSNTSNNGESKTKNTTTNNSNGNSSAGNQSSGSSNGNANLQSKTLYIDSNALETIAIKLEINNYSSNSSYDGNYSFYIRFSITNKTYSTKTYNVKNIKLTKMSTSATYTTSCILDELTIDAELQNNFSITSTIPSSLETDNYKLEFELDNYKLTYFLYETPDSLRENRSIKYYIAGTLVHTDTVKDKRVLEEIYTYDSNDHLYHCNTWYTNSSYTNQFDKTRAITSDINLYGLETSNLTWMTTGSDTLSFLNGVNHVHSDGTLVIPSHYLNKEISIGNYAIRNISVQKIYIPSTVHSIYTGNFTGIGNATIYYEGTQSEWESLFDFQNDMPTTNVVFNAVLPTF